jgi:hypothetical protein
MATANALEAGLFVPTIVLAGSGKLGQLAFPAGFALLVRPPDD